jgi:hypothetical protein
MCSHGHMRRPNEESSRLCNISNNIYSIFSYSHYSLSLSLSLSLYTQVLRNKRARRATDNDPP